MKRMSALIITVIASTLFIFSSFASMKGSMKGSDAGSSKGSVAKKPEVKVQALAVIKGTSEGSLISGKVMLKELTGGLHVHAELSNVSPGEHGFHIHANGSCADGGKAAGGHYNPDKTKHGLLAQDGPKSAHSGDMGNIVIGENGEGVYYGFLPGIGISGGVHSVAGRAIILHAKQDDFGQPTGNAGARIGCGTIVITNE